MAIRIEKPWGHEEIWAQTEQYVSKILHIRKGERLSLQHHIHKEENIRILKGNLMLTIGLTLETLQRKILHVGDTEHIPAGTIHRMEAIESCEIIEVSTTELEDIVRHEDDYGRIK